jgi:hypothetical protein
MAAFMDRDVFLSMHRWDEMTGMWVVKSNIELPKGIMPRAFHAKNAPPATRKPYVRSDARRTRRMRPRRACGGSVRRTQGALHRRAHASVTPYAPWSTMVVAFRYPRVPWRTV